MQVVDPTEIAIKYNILPQVGPCAIWGNTEIRVKVGSRVSPHAEYQGQESPRVCRSPHLPPRIAHRTKRGADMPLLPARFCPSVGKTIGRVFVVGYRASCKRVLRGMLTAYSGP
jgi:hypothetical protein